MTYSEQLENCIQRLCDAVKQTWSCRDGDGRYRHTHGDRMFYYGLFKTSVHNLETLLKVDYKIIRTMIEDIAVGRGFLRRMDKGLMLQAEYGWDFEKYEVKQQIPNPYLSDDGEKMPAGSQVVPVKDIIFDTPWWRAVSDALMTHHNWFQPYNAVSGSEYLMQKLIDLRNSKSMPTQVASLLHEYAIMNNITLKPKGK